MAFNVGITATFTDKTSRGLKKTARNIDRVGKTAQRAAGKLKGLRLALGLIAFGTLVRLGKGLVQTIGKLQLMFVRLSVVEGGAKKAKVSLDKLFKTFGTGPFSIDAVASSLIRLRSAGVDKDLAERIVEFGADAIAAFGGTSEELKRFSIGIQQVAGKGVLSMEELRQQIGEALPVAMRVFAVESGRSISQVIAAVEKGEIAAGEFIRLLADGLEKEFGGFQKRLGSTVLGSIQGAKSAIQKALIDIFVTGGNDATARLTVIFQKVGEKISDFIRNITASDVDDFFDALSVGAKFAVAAGQAIISLIRILITFVAFINDNFLKSNTGQAAVGAGLGVVGFWLLGKGPAGTVAGIALIIAAAGGLKGAFEAITGITIEAPTVGGVDKLFDDFRKSTDGLTKSQLLLNKAKGFFSDILDKDEARNAKVLADIKAITEAQSRQRIAIQGLNKTATDGARQLRAFSKMVEASLEGAASFPFVKKAITRFNRLEVIMKKFRGSSLELEVLIEKQSKSPLNEKDTKQLAKLTVELKENFDIRKRTQELIAKERGIGFARALFKANDKVKEIFFNVKKLIGGVSKQEEAVRKVNREYDAQLVILREQLLKAEALTRAGTFEVAQQQAIKDKIDEVNRARDGAVDRVKRLVALNHKILTLETQIAASQASQQIRELKRSTRGPVDTLFSSDRADQIEDRRSQLSLAMLETKKKILDIEKAIDAVRGDPKTEENLRRQIVILGEIAEAQAEALQATSEAALIAQELWRGVRDTMVQAAEEGLDSLITGAKTFKETMRDAFSSITRAAIKYLIQLVLIHIRTIAINAISGFGGGGGFAGAAAKVFGFSKGAAVQKFAKGGIASQIGSIVKGPTMFGMAGEAGIEGILPLANVGGKLGVLASGSGGNYNITIQAIDQQTGAQFLMRNSSMIINLLRNEAAKNGGIGMVR